MKQFIIDVLCEMVCHCGMNGMNYDGGIVATVSQSATIVMVSHGSIRALVCHGVQLYNGLSYVAWVKWFATVEWAFSFVMGRMACHK